MAHEVTRYPGYSGHDLLTEYNRLSVGCAKAIPAGTPADAALAQIDKCIKVHLPPPPPPGAGGG